MKIKIKEIFPVLIQGFPKKMKNVDIANIVIDCIPDFPYTRRTTQEYLSRCKNGNKLNIAKTRRDIEIDINKEGFLKKGFNLQVLVDHVEKENIILEDMGKEEIDDIIDDIIDDVIDDVKEEIPVTDIQDVKKDFGIKKWERNDLEYTWNASGGKKLSVSLELLDDIFFHYSKYGMNWTRSKICRKFNIKPKVFRSLTTAFELSKDSNIYAPHIPKNLSSEALDAYISIRMKNVFTSGERVEEKYTEAVNNANKKVIDEAILSKIEMENFLGEIAENIKKIPKEISIPINSGSNDEIIIGISDLHIGADVQSAQRAPDYNTTILKNYLKDVADYANKFKSKNVKIVIAGDLLEGTPNNHPNSFKNIELGKYWGYQLILATQVITEFLEQINNLASVHIVGGNHDRATGNNKGDTESTYASAIVHFLKEVYADKIRFQYHYDTINFAAVGAHFIVAHGDRGFHKRNVSELILEHGDPTKYNVILMGHLHSLTIPSGADHAKYMKIHLPSIFTGNEFSSSLGFSSLPGFSIFKRGDINPSVVDFTIKRL